MTVESNGRVLAELFSLTRDDSAWLNVSDGGHYDNTGIYEIAGTEVSLYRLVRRRFDSQWHLKRRSACKGYLNADLVLESVGPEKHTRILKCGDPVVSRTRIFGC
jgi:hypothetical protein